MMLAKDAEIHISATEAGPFTPFGKVLTAEKADEAGDDEEIYVLMEDEPIAAEGEDQGTYNVDYLHYGTDAGQQIARTARKNRTPVWLRVLLDGETGEEQKCSVRSVNWNLDRNGTGVNKYIRGRASFRTLLPATAIVAGP